MTRPSRIGIGRAVARRAFLRASAAVVLGVGSSRNAAAESLASRDVEEYARWLAGLGSDLGAEFDASGWTPERLRYAEAEAQRWRLATVRLQAIERWAAREIQALVPRAQTLFYPFAGPDAMHALALFGTATRFVLVGLEPIGSLPAAGPLGPGDQEASPVSYFDRLNAAWAGFHRLTFFRTRQMATDLHETGVVAILVTTIVRMGGRVTAIRYDAASPGPGVPPNAQVVWTDSGGGEHRLEYLQIDLSNAGLKRHAVWMGNLRALAPFVTFVKAGSYLLHEERFSFLRQVILEHSSAVVQDDSGIPFRFFESGWAIRLYGQYMTPVSPFEIRDQQRLREAFALRGAAPLPFGIGYHGEFGRSNLMLAIRGE